MKTQWKISIFSGLLMVSLLSVCGINDTNEPNERTYNPAGYDTGSILNDDHDQEYRSLDEDLEKTE